MSRNHTIEADAPEISAPERARLSALRERHDQVIVIVSPPRCSSTAFARVFWEHARVRYYCHEPFERTYYEGEGMSSALETLERPIDLAECYKPPPRAEGLVIKEMPYQVGARIDTLLRLASKPVIFLIRDPRLNIRSRIEKKREGGQSPSYPFVESGWHLLAAQIERCATLGIPYMIVDAGDFRRAPEVVFTRVFQRLGEFEFSPAMLRWRACPHIELDNLQGPHRHLYARVLASTGIAPEDEPVPALHEFPEDGGLRAHVHSCLEIYERLRASSARVTADGAS
jgi:hypothetical protein